MTRVLLLTPEPLDAEADAAAQWLRGRGHVVRRAAWNQTTADALQDAEVVWAHGAAVAHVDRGLGEALVRHVASGGTMLCTSGGATLPHAIGLEKAAPMVADGVWADASDPLWDAAFRDWPDFPHIRGLQGWGDHPLYDGFQRGTYTWQATEGAQFIELRRNPGSSARVVGVERAYVRLEEGSAVAWELGHGAGRVLCLGAFVSLRASADADAYAARCDRLLENALRYLVSGEWKGAIDSWYWPDAKRRDEVAAAPVRCVGDWPTVEAGLRMGATARSGMPFTVAGERALVVGEELTGVQEIWLHPLCALSATRVTRKGVALERGLLQPSPVLVDRTTWRGLGTLRERAIPALRDAVVVLEYDAPTVGLAGVAVELDVALRLAWPLAADGLQPVKGTLESDGTAWTATFLSRSGSHAACYTITGATQVSLRGTPAGGTLHVTAGRSAPLRIVVADGKEGSRRPEIRMLDLVSERSTRFRRLAGGTRIHTRESDLRTAFLWAKARLAMFMARGPAGGRGMLAGFAASRPGWGVSRPGYAWFFGRDACWCADALLAAGMVEEAIDVMRFLAATADVTGKVIHEYTTSGVAHYDAADSTPLFLRLVAAVAEWTGDLDAVRSCWFAVVRGLDHVASCDRDGDGLPENTGVGHGWVESGPLGGGALTSYVAAIWIDALRRLRPVAAALGDDLIAVRCEALLTRAEAGYRERLLDPVSGRSLLHRTADGAPDATLTALHAVPVMLDVEPDGRGIVRELLSHRFTTPWGVRMLPSDDPRYDPAGYHSGAVWPLFSGWLSLAAFATGDRRGGLQLLRANAGLPFDEDGAAGAFPEVLHGDRGVPVGICTDQAWSAAMVISPAIRGLWGVRPDMLGGAVTIAPSLPDEWQSASLTRLRVGGARIDVTVERSEDAPWTRVCRVRLDAGGPTRLRLHGGEGVRTTLSSSTGRTSAVSASVLELSVGTHEMLLIPAV